MVPGLKPQRRRRSGLTRVRTCFPSLAWLSVSLTMAPVGSATAGGIFETIFGLLSGRPPVAARGPLGYADPSSHPLDPSVAPRQDGRPGRGIAYCVRLCDGRYFPLTASDRESRAGTCNALCPATSTKIFWGSNAGPSVADDGTGYDALPNAYLYREQLLAGCTCNGKTSHGLAKIETTNDPTLRQGDIIATSEGMMVFAGTTRNGRRTTEFTPVHNYSPLPTDIRRKLATMRIGPVD